MTETQFIKLGRTGTVVIKGLKGKTQQPTLTLQTRNGEKSNFYLNSKEELDNVKIGQELRIWLEPVPQTLLMDEPKEIPPAVKEPPPFTCPKGALPDEFGAAEVCVDCSHKTETGCDQKTASPEEVTSDSESEGSESSEK